MKSQNNSTSLFDPSREPFTLEELHGLPAERHQFDEKDIWAVQAALAIGRPLLIRGEPGTGKSQLARAAAAVLNRPFIYEVVTAQIEISDLLWRFDAVARLGEAQILGACGQKDENEVREMLAPNKFISPGKIWWALNWNSAEDQAKLSRSPKQELAGKSWENGCVLLIDEIDKAESELPNALLECFANGSFHVPYCAETVTRASEQPLPLVVITTNEERELPAAFLRRCLVHHMELPKYNNELKAFLISRGNVHFRDRYSGSVSNYDDILEKAAERLVEDRECNTTGISKPGQAEYLDLCGAIFKISLAQNKDGVEVLNNISNYCLRKNSSQ